MLRLADVLINIEYEISERDFANAQRLAVKNSPMRIVRWSRLVLPMFGVAGLVFLVSVFVQQGFSWRLMPAGGCFMLFVSLPLLTGWERQRAYARTTGLQGRLSLATDESGLRFQGATFSSEIRWAHFHKFIEDDESFLLYSSPQVFHIVPKGSLSVGEIEGLRALLERNIAGTR